MKFPLAFLFVVTLISCSHKENRDGPQSMVTKKAGISIINYDSCKKIIKVTRQNQKGNWLKVPKEKKEKIFTKAVTETIIPAWIGTSWDFNGISEKPGQGSIACGYFVTTILRDAGLNLARIKLAQCASEQMITSLVQSKYIHRFSNLTMDDFIRSIKEQGYGLYIVGLDNHTGFIYNDANDTWFIHSSFIAPRKVLKEKASTSWILEKSKYKVLGKISADEKILEGWIN